MCDVDETQLFQCKPHYDFLQFIVERINLEFGNVNCHSVLSIDLRRFTKIAIQDKGPDGKWTRKPLAY